MTRNLLIISALFLAIVFPKCLYPQTESDIKPQAQNRNKGLLYGVVVTPKFYEEEHPFLLNGDFNNYKLYYKDYVFNNVKLRYNIHNQSVVYYQEKNNAIPSFIKLPANYIKQFIIKEKTKNKVYKSVNQYNLPNTKIKFYEVKYENHLTYLVGYLKSMTENLTLSSSQYKFKRRSKHFVILNGKAHQIRRPRDIYKLFEDKEDQIKKHKRRKHLSLRPKTPQDIIQILKFYEQLKFN